MVFQRDSRDGDCGAQLTELYREHSAAVYRFVFHLCGRREDAEDITQFAYLQAHRTLASGTVLEHPRAWLMTAAKRRWLTILRDRHDTPVDPTTLELDGHREPSPDADQELRDVRANLWALPEQQHQAFVLRHWSGLSYHEIAEVLETTPAAVESLLVRARATLVRDREEAGECVGVRRALEADRGLTAQMREHLSGCVRCRTARTRLAQVAGIAAVLALAPRQHVAEALASTVPGFSAGAATSAVPVGGGAALSGGGGAAGGATSAAAAGGKFVAALKVVTAVGAATAALTAAHVAHVPGTGGMLPGGHSGSHSQAAAHSHASSHSQSSSHSQAGLHSQAAAHRANTGHPGSASASSHRQNTSAHGRSATHGKPAGAGASAGQGSTSHGKSASHPAGNGHHGSQAAASHAGGNGGGNSSSHTPHSGSTGSGNSAGHGRPS